jgi:beta-mannanase
MSAQQEIYEMSMRFKDPDKYKEHMKAKMAFEDGDDNVVEGDDSYQGRTTSGGVGGIDVKSYAMKSNDSDESSSNRPEAKERAQKFKMDGTQGSDFTSV